MFETLSEYKNYKPGKTGEHKWKSPSNIALVKYWGKKNDQEPENPNISFSLKESVTITHVKYMVKEEVGMEYRFFFHGKQKDAFKPKINQFFSKIRPYFPFIDYLQMEINSENTFPHSTGIASSASAMSALSLALMSIYIDLSGNSVQENEFFKQASFISRLGSGSACRSVYPAYSVWGKNDISKEASDKYAIPLKLNETSFFNNLRDSILIVDSGEKSLTSSGGHGLMQTHPYAAARYIQAKENFNQLVYSLNSENVDLFIDIIENEALSLHALMMSSVPGTVLLKPGSLSIMDKVRKFRYETGIKVGFTIDAGPNIHLIYHDNDEKAILNFIQMELKPFCFEERVIHDRIGEGPEKLL